MNDIILAKKASLCTFWRWLRNLTYSVQEDLPQPNEPSSIILGLDSVALWDNGILG